MRLLYVLPSLAGRGGVARSAARMIEALRAVGHHIAVVAPDPNLFPGDVRLEGDHYRFGALELARPRRWVEPVRAAIDRWRPDVVVGYYGTTAGHAAAVAGHRAGSRVVVCLRGNDVDRDRTDPARRPLLAEALTCAGAITTVSTSMADIVRRELGAEARFIPNSIDRQIFHPDPDAGARLRRRLGVPAEAAVAGVFGEIKAKRGIAELAATGALRPWHVVVVGHIRPEQRAALPPDWIRIDYLDDLADLRAAYSACDVVVQPSLDDGMPNVLLEAMACARTVVASPVGGIPDLVRDGENGLLCACPAAWVRTLEALRRNPRLELGAAARASVPDIAVERAAFEATFAELSGERPQARESCRRP